MALARTFRSRAAAVAHRDAVVSRLGLPSHYSQRDLDDGTIREEGGGRHVPPERIVRQDVPALRFHPQTDSWVVAAGESEEADEETAAELEELPRLELVEPDEAPKARGGKGLVRDPETGELKEKSPPKKKAVKRG